MPRKKGSKNTPTDKTAQISVGKAMAGGFQNPNSLFSVGAQTVGNTLQKTGNYSVSQTGSFFYSPELTTESWLLPKSRQEILKWCRIFFNLEPYVQSIITLHADSPFSKFDIITPDETVTEFYKQAAQEVNLLELLYKASLSYNKFGEAIFFGNMKQTNDKSAPYLWEKFVLLEPELVEVKTDMFSGKKIFEMVPTEELKSLVTSTRPEDIERKEILQKESPEVFKAILDGRNIRLDEESVSMLANETDPSATRGTSPIQACFKCLIYQDWIRLAQSAYAQRYVFPVELWTIGDMANNIMPDDAALEKFRGLIREAVANPPFSMVFPPIVKYEPLSTLGKNFPINNEYDYIQDQLMVALGVNRNILLGDGPSFSNIKSMSMHSLIQRYKKVRDRFEAWMVTYFFKPLAEKNGFYSTSNGRKKLILPEIAWYKSLDIEAEEAERDQFIQLHDKGFISTETLFTKFPSLDYRTEQAKLEKERGTVWDKGSDNRIPSKITKSIIHPSSRGGGGGSGMLPSIKPIAPIPPVFPEESLSKAPMDAVSPLPESIETTEIVREVTPTTPPPPTEV